MAIEVLVYHQRQSRQVKQRGVDVCAQGGEIAYTRRNDTRVCNDQRDPDAAFVNPAYAMSMHRQSRKSLLVDCGT